ncbi:MAG: ABC transporter permease [Prevotellaceae bacterium]|jgi:molybdate/tungstate transport system permease protein|nr:ABC transporter permease [Prevotellaceae bacterium]
MKRLTLSYLIFLLLAGFALLFIIAPLIGLFFSTNFPDLFAATADTQVHRAVWMSLGVSAASTILSIFAALPLAYLMARRDFWGKGMVQGIIDIPIVIPHSAAGIAVLGLISRDSMLGGLAQSVGINLIDNPIGIGLAMAFVSIPFLINAARDGFEAVPIRLEQAAHCLGASSTKVFWTVALPLAKRSVITGLVLMFARGMSEFGAVVIVAYHPMTAPVLIFDRFQSFGLAYARPVAVLFVGVCLVVFVGLRWIGRKK